MALGYQPRVRQLWQLRILTFVLLAVCVFVAWSAYTRWQVEREMAARREAVELEYQALQERHQSLQAEVEYLKDERSLESEIRKHFDVAREGESVIILLDDTETAATATAPRQSFVPPESSWWQFWR